jgi:hypothetical protein
LIPHSVTPAAPLMKFATNADGDIAGWRVQQMPASAEISPKIPMVWVRDPSALQGWVPVRLIPPTGGDVLPWRSAAASGSVRMRLAPGAPAQDELFVAGWSEIDIGIDRLKPMLWRVRKLNGVWSAESISIETYYTPEPGEPQPEKVGWPSSTRGSAWCTNAIEISHAPNHQGQTIPWLVVYAAQGFPCRNPCTGLVDEATPAAGVVPMRFVVEAETLRLNTVPPQAVSPIPWTLTESFQDPLFIGYPAILDRCPDTPIACDSGAGLWMKRIPRSITVRPDGKLDIVRSGYYWNTHPDDCYFQTGLWLAGPSAGTMVLDSISSLLPAIAEGPHLLGADTESNGMPFIERIPGHVTRVIGARGIQLELLCGDECTDKYGVNALLQPLYSDHMESALHPDPSAPIDTLLSAGWRRVAKSPAVYEAMAWLPRRPSLPIEESCGLISPTEDYSRTVIFQQPPQVLGIPFTGAWSLGVEYVREGRTHVPQAVGGSSHGALWWNGADSWSSELLLANDSHAAAHSISPAGEIVVLGKTCHPADGSLSPIRVVARGTVGDLNGDGPVDAADLSILLIAWGTSNPFADFNADGLVDAADLAIFLLNWT